MAGQGLFLRVSTLANNCRLLLNNRLLQINQVSGVKQKAADKLKDLNLPEKPKRPLSPYFKFVQEHRSSIVKQHPDWKVTDVGRQCAADWRALDQSTKERYERDFKVQLEEYAKQYTKYTQKLTDEQKKALKDYQDEMKKNKARRKLRKKGRDNNKPKRPMGPYFIYVMEQAKLQDRSYAELLSELKTKWAELSNEEKSKYLEEAARAKERYEQEMKAWEQKMIDEGNEDIVRNRTLAEKSLINTKKKESTAKSKDE